MSEKITIPLKINISFDVEDVKNVLSYIRENIDFIENLCQRDESIRPIMKAIFGTPNTK